MNTQLAQKAFLIGALSLVALSTLGSATSSHVDEAASGDRRRQIEERELGPGRQTPSALYEGREEPLKAHATKLPESVRRPEKAKPVRLATVAQTVRIRSKGRTLGVRPRRS